MTIRKKKLQAYEGDILKTEPTKKGNIASSVYTILGVNGVIVGVLFEGYPNAWIHSSHRKIPPSASATIHIIHRSISTHSKANICNITAEHRFSQKSHVFLQPLDFPGRSISIHVKTPWPWNIPLLQAEAAINQDVPAADSVPPGFCSILPKWSWRILREAKLQQFQQVSCFKYHRKDLKCNQPIVFSLQVLLWQLTILRLVSHTVNTGVRLTPPPEK